VITLGKGRIVEVYYHKKLLKRKNPLGGRTKMRVVGGCIIATKTKGKVRYSGAGTVKLIPLGKKDIKAIGKTTKRKRKKR